MQAALRSKLCQGDVGPGSESRRAEAVGPEADEEDSEVRLQS